jgi:outer membrane protein assembly factor BamA
LLQKAGYDFDGEILTIHAGKKFAKTQLDKALPSLSSALQEIGQTNATVNVLPTPKPPADGQTAAILAIMGGGEEVKING